MAEQVFLLMGEVWSMHNADTQCTVQAQRPMGRENFLCLNFSCLAIKYEYYFTVLKEVLMGKCVKFLSSTNWLA